MNGMHCRVTFNGLNENSSIIMRRDAEYWLTPQSRIIERINYQLNGKKLFIIFLSAVLALVFAIFICVTCTHNKYAPQKKEIVEVIDTGANDNQEEIFTEDFVEEPTFYDRCLDDYLSEAEVWEFYKQEGPSQLQFCINFIYAHHGQIFKPGGINDTYFSKQEWYQNLEKREVCYEDLNSYEQKNVDMFVTVLKAEGYRN